MKQTLDMQNLNVIHFVDNIDAVCVQFNRANNLLAVGCKNSEVILYEISKNKQFTERSRISLEYRGFTSKDLGFVSSICFSSHDGLVISVGYSNRGFAVFHISGICIMTSLPLFADNEIEQ